MGMPGCPVNSRPPGRSICAAGFPDGREKISFAPGKPPRFAQTSFYIKQLIQRAGPPGSGKSAIKNVAGSGMAAEFANRHGLAKLLLLPPDN
jgi:hypothetical protein